MCVCWYASYAGASAAVAPVHNIWAAKAEKKAQQKQKAQKKGKGKGKAKKPPVAGGTKGVKRTAGAAPKGGKHKRPRPAGCRSSSRHATISPVFADTVSAAPAVAPMIFKPLRFSPPCVMRCTDILVVCRRRPLVPTQRDRLRWCCSRRLHPEPALCTTRVVQRHSQRQFRSSMLCVRVCNTSQTLEGLLAALQEGLLASHTPGSKCL